MGDDVEVLAVELLYGGLLQVDFHCKDPDFRGRLFIPPDTLFPSISKGIQKQFEKEMNRRDAMVSIPERSSDLECSVEPCTHMAEWEIQDSRDPSKVRYSCHEHLSLLLHWDANNVYRLKSATEERCE